MSKQRPDEAVVQTVLELLREGFSSVQIKQIFDARYLPHDREVLYAAKMLHEQTPPYVIIEEESVLVIVPEPPYEDTRVAVVDWHASVSGDVVHITGTDRNNQQRHVDMPLSAQFYEEDTLLGDLTLLPAMQEEVNSRPRPCYGIDYNVEIAREQRASARKYRDVRNRLGMIFRPAQEEAMRSWLQWEAQMDTLEQNSGQE